MTKQRMIIANFKEFKTRIKIDPIRSLNPELLDAFEKGLPFEGIATHSVVSGLNITCWTPVFACVPITTKERIYEMPIGRVFLSGHGNKILFKYGPQTHWGSAPPIGQVEGEDLILLQDIGPKIWESVFFTKRLYHIMFSLEEQS